MTTLVYFALLASYLLCSTSLSVHEKGCRFSFFREYSEGNFLQSCVQSGTPTYLYISVTSFCHFIDHFHPVYLNALQFSVACEVHRLLCRAGAFKTEL